MSQLPHIKGTADDGQINGLIDVCNKKNSPAFTAHAAAAIVRFCMENHEVEVGSNWMSRVMPLVEDAKINGDLVDKILARLTEASEHKHSGCSPAFLAAILLATLIGTIWWLFT